MLANFWRYSHLLLAILSSVFLFIASVTGIILSTEPVGNYIQSPSDRAAADTTKLADLIPQLQEDYIEVFSISVDKEKAVKVDVIGFDEETDGEFYIHPSTGKKIAEIPPKNEIYSWTTTLHRSLFMHNSGRIIMGITVFLLLLMAISGIALVIKRTNGIRHIVAKIKKQNRAQYYHTVLGRLSFIPIVVMAFGGSVLFLDTQGLLPDQLPVNKNEIIINIGQSGDEDFEQNTKNYSGLSGAEAHIFNLTLTQIKTLNFPFSSDETDYFELELHDRKLKIHQYTGAIVAEEQATWMQQLTALSMTLHTGRGQFIWAFILGLISINLLYFMYSGTKIAWKRMASKTRNKVSPAQAEFILLVGSENGSTRRFATILHNSLLKAGQLVYTAELNHYQTYKNAKHLIVLTSTYGDGEAPFNARNFLKKVDEIEQPNILKTHIIGFGSMSYPQFCQYAIEVYEKLDQKEAFNLKGLPSLIDGQSYTSFNLAIEDWKKRNDIKVQLPNEDNQTKVSKSSFVVADKHIVYDGFALTFTLELSPVKNTTFQSGDLLAIAPPEENVVRYYSIGKTDNGNILLSIRKHSQGLCSSYLYEQEIGNEISAIIKQNKNFHLPKKGDVLMIANGTGIAPFLGMTSMYSNQKKTFLLGGRNTSSFKLYHQIIQQNESTDLFNTIHFALSKEEGGAKYVQDLVVEHKRQVLELIRNKGTIMICGSLTMRDGVLVELRGISEENGVNLEELIERGKIRMDCY